MAVYQAAMSWAEASEICTIPKVEIRGGVTVYVIRLHVPPFKWHVCHRYSEFSDLHEKLTAYHNVDKTLLPPKKLFGSQSETFISKRQADLELYLQTLIHQFVTLPPVFASFLDFHIYETHVIVGNLAEKLFIQGDLILSSKQHFTFSPLELSAIMQRLKLAEPTLMDNKCQDLGHLLSFISQLKYLRIQGNSECVGNSNMIPNKLVFNLSPFKTLESLELLNCEVKDCLESVEPFRQTLKTLVVHDTLKDISSMILCDIIHWSPDDQLRGWMCWNNLTSVDFSHNVLDAIHPCMKLLPCVEILDLSYNKIQEIENLESLPRLSVLNLSHNKIQNLPMLHTRLGNIHSLFLTENRIEHLKGLSKLFSLIELTLNNNCIALLSEIAYIGKLPCLEQLNLSHNPVSTAVDFRSYVLLSFGARASELCLDGMKAAEKELDTIAVLQALQISKQENISDGACQKVYTLDQNSSISQELHGDQVLYQNSVNK